MAHTVWFPAGDESDALIARAYGDRSADLIVNFDRPLQEVITALLASCLSGPENAAFDDAEVARWTIAKRRQGLLAVSVATNGPMRWLTADCGNCSEKLDLHVNLTDFRQDWRAEDVDLGEAKLRLPTLSDLAGIGDDATQLAHILLEGDAPEGRKGDAWESKAEAALELADPLADLELGASCPDCGAKVVLPLLLETYLIREMGHQALLLMDDIHVLALAYHWSEPQIMALPENRRRHYLARVREVWAA